MEIPIIFPLNSISELQASTKVLKKGETFHVQGVGLFIALEDGPANDIGYDYVVDRLGLASNEPSYKEVAVLQLTYNGSLTIQHNGARGGVFYSINGADPVWAPVAVNTNLQIVSSLKRPVTVAVWINAESGGVPTGIIPEAGLTRITASACVHANINGCSTLEQVSISGSSLSTINIADLDQLTSIYIPGGGIGGIKYLDIRGKSLLTSLDTSESEIEHLLMEGPYPNLQQFVIGTHNEMEIPLHGVLDLTVGFGALTNVDIARTKISELKLGAEPNLMYVQGYHCPKLTTVDLGGCTAINEASFSNSGITSFIPPSGHGFKARVYVDNNQLSAEALNTAFTLLDPTPPAGASFNVANNPGSATCNPALAPAGWSINTGV